jgi:hypothetical protein
MEITVTRANKETNNPRIDFTAEWLEDMGFVHGALVQFLPEPYGATFILCNENIAKYSKLYHSTKSKGGILTLVHGNRGLNISVSGTHVKTSGLAYGDKLIVSREYGFIQMRKLP